MSILRSTKVGIPTDTPPVLSIQKKSMTEHLLQEIDFYSYNNESALLFQEEREKIVFILLMKNIQMTNWD